MIDRGHDLPIAKQAKALGISRGSVYSMVARLFESTVRTCFSRLVL